MTKKKFLIILFITVILSFILAITGNCSNFGLNFSDKNDSVLKLVQLSDVHFDSESKDNGRRLYSNSADLLQDAVDQINNIDNVDFVIFSGDSINRPSCSDLIKFIRIINNLKAPWYLSTGNHEISVGGGLTKSQRLNIINTYNNRGFKSDKSYYSFSPKKGYLIIVMDGVIDSRITANGFFPKKQLEWLNEQLDSNPDSKVIIVQHFPVIEPIKSPTHRVLNSENYMDILNRHKNVIAVLSGHYHIAKIIKAENVVHASAPALIEYPNAFRVITINNKNNRIQINFEFKETRLKDLQQQSKSRSKSWKLAQGEESDRNATIILK